MFLIPKSKVKRKRERIKTRRQRTVFSINGVEKTGQPRAKE